jgi:hypothetical protein
VFEQTVPHIVNPHVARQMPNEQTWPEGHACPHEPQFAASVVTFTHAVPHATRPGTQATPESLGPVSATTSPPPPSLPPVSVATLSDATSIPPVSDPVPSWLPLSVDTPSVPFCGPSTPPPSPPAECPPQPSANNMTPRIVHRSMGHSFRFAPKIPPARFEPIG